jgi:hypothetical protein
MANRLRNIARQLWCFGQDILTLAAVKPAPKAKPRVYYGGAQRGYAGGPQVKVGMLQKAFPEKRLGFNLVYLLSGALYLSQKSLKRLNEAGVPIVLNQNGVFFPAWYPKGYEKQNARLAEAMASARMSSINPNFVSAPPIFSSASSRPRMKYFIMRSIRARFLLLRRLR